jgi:hypothetical protein
MSPSQVVSLANKAQTTMRDALNRMQVTHYVEERPQMLRRLKELGTLLQSTAKVALIRPSVASRLLNKLGLPSLAGEAINRLKDERPPAVRHRQGAPSEDHATRYVDHISERLIGILILYCQVKTHTYAYTGADHQVLLLSC